MTGAGGSDKWRGEEGGGREVTRGRGEEGGSDTWRKEEGGRDTWMGREGGGGRESAGELLLEHVDSRASSAGGKPGSRRVARERGGAELRG